MSLPYTNRIGRQTSRRYRVVCLSLLSALLLILLTMPTAAAETMNLTQYQEALQTAVATLQRDPGTASTVAAELRAITQVTLPDGSTIEPDLTSIISDLDASPPQTDDATTTLTAILDQMDLAGTNANAQRTEEQDQLNSVLARSEFHRKAANPRFSITRWIGHQLRRLLEPLYAPVVRLARNLLRGLMPSPGVWLTVVGVLGLSAILFVVVASVRSIRRGFGPAVAYTPFAPGAPVKSASELRGEAESLAQGSSYRLAIRTLYLAALVRLEERGVLRFERALTNREVLKTAAVSGGPDLAERLAPLVDRFDRYWYGVDLCTEREYREFAQLSSWAWETS
jgi:type II secretory pathway pseudopilin PulG